MFFFMSLQIWFSAEVFFEPVMNCSENKNVGIQVNKGINFSSERKGERAIWCQNLKIGKAGVGFRVGGQDNT